MGLAQEGLLGLLLLFELLAEGQDELAEDERVDVLAQLVDEEPEKWAHQLTFPSKIIFLVGY